MQVWIMMKGELSEGGDVIDVYTDKNLAFEDFIREATKIDDAFGLNLDRSGGYPDGSVRVEGGCDWLDLSPYDVKTAPALPAVECYEPAESEPVVESWFA